MRAGSGVKNVLLYLVAFAWPWDVFRALPYSSLSLTALAGLALSLILVLDLRQGRRFRLPFELLWPLCLLVLLALWDFFFGSAKTPLVVLPFAIFYAAIVHFAASRTVILRSFFLSAVAGAAIGALSLIAGLGFIFPTAYNPLSGAVLLPAYNIHGGAFNLFLCFLMGILFLHPDSAPRCYRQAALLSSAVTLLALCTFLLQEFSGGGGFAPLLFLLPTSPLHFLGLLLFLWILVRIFSKLILLRMEEGPGIHTTLLILLGLALLGGVLGGASLHAHVGFVVLAGLLSAYALPSTPYKGEAEERRLMLLAVLPVLLLALAHLSIALPGTPADGRHYLRRIHLLYTDKDFQSLHILLDFLEPRTKQDPAIPLWRAKASLSQGNLQAAATTFCQLARAKEAYPRLSEQEIDAFLAQLRDYCSALAVEERGLAYEQALVAAGRANNALTSLEIRLSTLRQATDLSADDLAQDLAALLGDPALYHALRQWEASALLEILVQSGIRPPAFSSQRR